MRIAIQRTGDPATTDYPWEWLVTDIGDEIASGSEPDFGLALNVALQAFRADVEDQGATITRDNQQTDVIYVGYEYVWGRPSLTIFVTPDGIGRYYFDSIGQARREHGDLPIHYVSTIED